MANSIKWSTVLFLNFTVWYFIFKVIGGLLPAAVLESIGNGFGIVALIFGFIGAGLFLLRGGD